MRVTRDVILDLWPVYESGAASDDTRTLVEEFLGGDPEFARRIRAGEEKMSEVLMAVPVLPNPDAERAALGRTQLLLRLRYYFLAFACVLTLSAGLLRQFRSVTIVGAVLSAAAWALVWKMARNPHFASLLPAPRVETRAQRIWTQLRGACLVVAVFFTMFSTMFHPRYRHYPAAYALAALGAWVVLVVAERLTTGRK